MENNIHTELKYKILNEISSIEQDLTFAEKVENLKKYFAMDFATHTQFKAVATAMIVVVMGFSLGANIDLGLNENTSYTNSIEESSPQGIHEGFFFYGMESNS